MPIQIREMSIEDYQEVFTLWSQSEGVGLNEADSRENIAAYLDRNPGLSLVACRERVVAAVLCGHDGRRGYLHHLAVAAGERRKGLGRRLVDACLGKLALVGIQRCNVFLYTDNAAGERFWKQAGWTERSELKILHKPTAPAASP